jgi:hypothetical protein
MRLCPVVRTSNSGRNDMRYQPKATLHDAAPQRLKRTSRQRPLRPKGRFCDVDKTEMGPLITWRMVAYGSESSARPNRRSRLNMSGSKGSRESCMLDVGAFCLNEG